MKPLLLLMLALWLGPSLAEVANVNTFKYSFFKSMIYNKGFEPIQSGLEDAEDEPIAAVGFVNKDFYTDLITLTPDGTKAHFWIYDDAAGVFKKMLESDVLPNGEILTSVKLCEPLSSGGLPTIVFISYAKTSSSVTTHLRGYTLSISGNSYSLQSINGYAYSSSENNAQQPQEPFGFQIADDNSINDYWMFNNGGKRQIVFFNSGTNLIETKDWVLFADSTCAGCLPMTTVQNQLLGPFYFAAVADLNRDCRSDMVVQSTDGSGNKFLEFYLFTDKGTFGLVKFLPAPENFLAGALVDVNEDYSTDFVYFDSKTKELVTIFNTFVSTSTNANLHCLLSSEIVFSFPGFGESGNTIHRQVQKILSEETLDTIVKIRSFPTLRFADINLDGYLDLMITVNLKTSYDPWIFISQPCSEEKATAQNTDVAHCRIFDSNGLPPETMAPTKGKTAQLSMFFDFGEQGKLGILSLEKNSGGKLKYSFYLNHLDTDYYFLKALGFSNTKEIQSLNGVTFLIERSTDSESVHVFSRTQRSNCPFSENCLPFAHFGLAKINNYVTYFQAGINKADTWNNYWSPIIPNSQLIAYADPQTQYNWKLNIFINPTSAMMVIFISTVVVLLIIGSIVIYMHLKEKKMDKKFRMDDINLL